MQAPTTAHDLYSDELLNDPYEVYDELRSQGAAVWMEAHQAYVLPRYDGCREALRTWKVFSSAHGVMMNDPINQALGGRVMLCTDGEQHARQRVVVAAPLTLKALTDVRSYIESEAVALVDRVVAGETFDAAGEFAHHLPVTIVGSLVGVPEAGRDRLVEWASAAFNTIGPINQRTIASFPLIEEMNAFVEQECTREKVTPGSWSAGLWDAADRGDLAAHEPQIQINNYLGPALDTTIHSTTNMIWLFARHPDQWALLRRRPELVPDAINEVLRIESVIQGFSRFTTENYELDGIPIPAGSRTLVLYGSANRDDRHFADPTRFDIERFNAGDHLSLGHGSHACPGGHLARMEMRALLEALLPKVERFELIESSRAINNVIRGLATCTVKVKPASN